MRLVEKMLVQRLPEQASKVECRNFYLLGNLKAQVQDAFQYLPGNVPVLLSAPHAVRHIRLGRSKPADTFTGTVAVMLNHQINCSALVNRRDYGGDPNFDSVCGYKHYLGQILENRQVCLVLDIHGAADKHNFDVDLGTMYGRSLKDRPEYLSVLIECFKSYGIKKVSVDYFPAVKQYTVTRYVTEHMGIPALQLEINKKYRRPYKNPEEFCRLIAALQKFIRRISNFS